MLCNSEVRMTKIAWNAAIVLQHAMHEFSVEGGGGFIITSPLWNFCFLEKYLEKKIDLLGIFTKRKKFSEQFDHLFP